MTIQEAAHQILDESRNPLSSKEIARIALERRMVISTAQDPIQSHAQTIEKNIRDDIYNKPKLIFVHTAQGRLIGLPGWDVRQTVVLNSKKHPDLIELKAKIPTDLFEKIKLAEQAKLKDNLDETVSLLLSRGLSSVASEIKKGLMTQLESLT